MLLSSYGRPPGAVRTSSPGLRRCCGKGTPPGLRCAHVVRQIFAVVPRLLPGRTERQRIGSGVCWVTAITAAILFREREPMGDSFDYFHAQPEEVKQVLVKTAAEADEGKVQATVRSFIEEKFAGRYTERQVQMLVYVAMYMAWK